MTAAGPADWRPQGIADLEANAWVALQETGRSVCVTAGPGAGKTEFLAQKAAYLLQTGICLAPKRILAISFKRDAARNLGLRVQERCAPARSRRFDSMTFDAFTKNLLDRFRAAIPAPHAPPPHYRIVFPKRADYDHFLRGIQASINAKQLERLIARTSLPIKDSVLPEHLKQALTSYWAYQYEKLGDVSLSFFMINRLIDYMLRLNPQVQEALQITYPFVFLDEFQDTTVAQYELLKTAFAGSNAVFTAVGDDKQRIMGWADAMPGAFQIFAQDFNAKRVSLFLNWRSHESLVAIQRVVAAKIDPNTGPVEARAPLMVDGDIAAIWEFDSRQAECEGLAAWLRAQVDSGIVEPHDVAILVRMRVDDAEAELAPVLAAQGLALRNLARNVGSIAIQDLLAEELTGVLLPLLRLGAGVKDPDAWATAQTSLRFLLALSNDDEIGQQALQRDLEDFSRQLRAYLGRNPPDANAAKEATMRAIGFAGAENLRQAFPEYGRDDDFNRVRDGFQLLLAECAEAEDTWPATLDRFEGRQQVPLMTIHKSKELEFHTMVFFGLDDRSWRSLQLAEDEELNAFFVAFTRAKQRAFFTSCSERGDAIDWLDELLAPAGVARLPGPAAAG